MKDIIIHALLLISLNIIMGFTTYKLFEQLSSTQQLTYKVLQGE